MTGAEAAIAAARSFIGVRESPPYSNNVIFNTKYYGRAVSGDAYPWCCVFVWYVFDSLGWDALFYGGGKTASCTVLMNWARSNGRFVSRDYRPGDLIFYNFGQTAGLAEHIGVCTAVKSESVVTVEGNTGVSSDADGGEVMERLRAYTYVIGALRPAYPIAAPEPVPAPDDTSEGDDEMVKRYNTVAEMPDWASATVRKLVAKGFLQGSGARGANGDPADMDLSEDMLRMFVVGDRAGAYGG